MDENNKDIISSTDEELAKAYEADKERKIAREDELQAARDYLGVLLEEAEDRNEELKDKKQEADALAERLSRTEEEIKQLKSETEAVNRNNNHSTIWMCFAIFELLLIAGLALAFYIRLSDKSSIPNNNENALSADVQPGIQNEQEAAVNAEPATARYVDDLELRVKYLSAEAIAPFTASVEKIEGLEYLVFTKGDIKVCYRNEYFLEDMSFRKAVLIEKDSNRYIFSRNYDFDTDMVELCPKLTHIGLQEMLAFIDYNGNSFSGIPREIRLISCANFRLYACTDLSERIGSLMSVEALEERSPLADSPAVYRLSTSMAQYNFAVPDEYVTEIQYNEYAVPEYDSTFELVVDDNGLSWSALVKLGEQRYMGKISGSLILTDSGLGISGAKFAAFAPANQEDEELMGYIRAAAYVPDRYVTILGNNNERYLIEVSDKVEPVNYYWDNLNTDDPNNWIYYDADGNIASHRGIDVSKYQKTIDWEKVAAAGVEFAIIRLGFRGMNEGTLEMDEYFTSNIKGALKNGIKVGIYFFSQAVNEKEALEEADFVLNAIKNYDITYPIVFDTERVTTFAARANGLSVEQRTAICRSFCDAVAAQGYKPMIYANTKYMIMGIDLEQLTDYDKWFACYSQNITFPYNFQILQYSESGTVDGVPEKVDLNISFVDYAALQ